MLRSVHETVRRHGLIRPGDHVLVAVSGGADSVALLHALHYFSRRLGFRISVAHLNHGIRGREADRDEEFVRQLAWKLGRPFLSERVDVPALARKQRVSVEMAARDARQDFLARAAARQGANLLTTAHTADDQAETVLLRLLRGTGPQGLGGMTYRSARESVTLIRPMLDVTHEDAIQFLQMHKRSWHEDATNRDLAIPRNWIRHQLLPLLERRMNPRVRAALVRLADLMREENAWTDAKVSRAAKAGPLPVAAVSGRPVAEIRRIIVGWLIANGVDAAALDFDAIERIAGLARKTAGTQQTPLTASVRVVRLYKQLVLRTTSAATSRPFAVNLPVPGMVHVSEAGLRVVVARTRGYVKPPAGRAGDLPSWASVGAKAVGRSPLTLRAWKPGDRIRPLGMVGSRKVQDILTDQKVPRETRGLVPVLVCRGEVVWIPGFRLARGWTVPGPRAQSLTITVERA